VSRAASSRATPRGAWCLSLLVVAAFTLACGSGENGSSNPAGPSPLQRLVVSPAATSLSAGGVQTFVASAVHGDGTTSTPPVTWSATGGTITPTGVFTAGATAGSFEVTAGVVGGNLTTSAVVAVVASQSPIVSISVSPNSATLATGGTQNFTATATRQDGSTLVPEVTWTATGGTITSTGA
jgi:hypothetical protein